MGKAQALFVLRSICENDCTVHLTTKECLYVPLLVKGRSFMDTSPSLGKNFNPFGQHLEEPFAFYTQLRHEEPITFSPVLNAYLVSRF